MPFATPEPPLPPRWRQRFAGAALMVFCAAAAALPMPPEMRVALRRAAVPPQAVTVLVQEIGATRPLVGWRTEEPVNPASVMKLVTTAAALDLLGPAWSWSTPVWLDGPLQPDGTLEGNLVVRGSGDPTLVVERVWLLLRRVQQLGVRRIHGDIVLDRSAFVPDTDGAGDFDGEALRPYNVRPDALLLAHRAVVFTFTPDVARGVATVTGGPTPATLPLADGACGDWLTAVRPAALPDGRWSFAGRFPASCGERSWAAADPHPADFDARFLAALWREMGGVLDGRVRDGSAPETPPGFAWPSPPLALVVRDINKYSNNVMAQQLFLTLGRMRRGEGSPAAARTVLQDWLAQRFGSIAGDAVVDNGSGLSRSGRVSARLLGALLQQAWAGPWMPELLASLPVPGVDGTLQRSAAGAGRAHLKTGSLRDVAAQAGVVSSQDGRRYVVVAIVNHANAGRARPALDALVDWVAAGPTTPPAPAAGGR